MLSLPSRIVGYLIATSNANITTVQADGTPIYPPEVPDTLLNATMMYLLAQNTSNIIDPMDYMRYSEILLFINRKVMLNGANWIVSCDLYSNADHTVCRPRCDRHVVASSLLSLFLLSLLSLSLSVSLHSYCHKHAAALDARHPYAPG